jgi:hypothetical protein
MAVHAIEVAVWSLLTRLIPNGHQRAPVNVPTN